MSEGCQLRTLPEEMKVKCRGPSEATHAAPRTGGSHITRANLTPPNTRFGFHQNMIGAGEGIRTLDPNLGKVVLYP